MDIVLAVIRIILFSLIIINAVFTLIINFLAYYFHKESYFHHKESDDL